VEDKAAAATDVVDIVDPVVGAVAVRANKTDLKVGIVLLEVVAAIIQRIETVNFKGQTVIAGAVDGSSPLIRCW
jgi:hypothetical protein